MGLLSRIETTVIQLSTPRQQGGVHVIRLSGKESLPFLCEHTGLAKALQPRLLYHTSFFTDAALGIGKTKDQDGKKCVPLDSLLCVYFPAPHSYTGEDMVELHTHGSLYIVDRLLSCALSAGLALANRGEFTYRAFLNGKLTLEQAEAIDALITAKSRHTHENALRILEEKASLRFTEVHQDLRRMLAKLESTIEFPEEDLPEIDDNKETLYAEYYHEFQRIRSYFVKILENYHVGKKYEDGITVAILGPPNVGKSTLMNALLRLERALVSAEAGTTRDYLQEAIDLDGLKFVLTDTAGLHVSEDQIEQAGMVRTREMARHADLCIVLLSLATENSEKGTKETIESVSEKLQEQLMVLEENFVLDQKSGGGLNKEKTMLYLNKADLMEPTLLGELRKVKTLAGYPIAGIFSLTPDTDIAEAAVHAVETKLLARAEKLSLAGSGEEMPVALLNLRQANIAEKIISGLEQMLSLVKIGESEEILAEEFRLLSDCFAELGLTFSHDEIYDTLFSQFCIGK